MTDSNHFDPRQELEGLNPYLDYTIGSKDEEAIINEIVTPMAYE